MNEESIATISQYMDERLFEPRWNWPKAEFEQRSCSRWAAAEIVELLTDNPFTPAIALIEEFVMKMCFFLCMAERTNKSVIFLSAIDTAEEIQRLLKGENND